MDSRRPAARGVRIALDTWVLALSVVLVWPLLTSSGYPLARDLVFTPHQPMRTAWLGLGDAPARAVPLDAIVSLVDAIVGGAVLSRFAILGLLVLAGAAAHRVLAGAGPVARAAVAGFAVWNPFVIERLALGQWALLWAYAAAFAIVGTAAHYRRGEGGWRELAPLSMALAVAAITPTGALVGAAVALVVGWGGRLGQRIMLLGACAAVQLPWLVPTLLGEGSLLSDPRGLEVFAARAERPGGAIWSLVGLGGIWDAASVPASRTGAFGHASSVLVVVALVLGWAPLRRLLGRGTRLRLVVLGACGLLAAALTTSPAGLAVGTFLVQSVPGAGLLRDSQKLLLPFAVVAVLFLGAATEGIARRTAARARVLAPTLAVLLVALPIVAVPDATTSTWRTLRPVTYPADLEAVARIVDGTDQDLVTLPWEPYRVYAWGNAAAVFDPASRWFDVDVVMSDRLRIGSTRLRGESSRSATVESTLGGPSPIGRRLAAIGVRWVLVQRHQTVPADPGARAADDPFGAGASSARPGIEGVVTRFAGSEVTLLETVGPWTDPPTPAAWRTALVAAVDLLLLAGAALAAATVVSRRIATWLAGSRRLLVGMLRRTQRGS